MVHYLAATGAGVDRYAETAWDILDMPAAEVSRRAEYADAESVHPSALKNNVARLEQGYWMKLETLPKKVLWANGSKPLPDVLPRFVISSRFRDLVEQFEPGVHQFVPVAIYKDRGGKPVATYYWFIVGQRIDSIDRDRTTYIWKAPADDPEAGYWTRRLRNLELKRYEEIPGAKLVFSETKAFGYHIWHDPHLLTGGERLCSDAFAAALNDAGYTGVRTSPRESA